MPSTVTQTRWSPFTPSPAARLRRQSAPARTPSDTAPQSSQTRAVQIKSRPVSSIDVDTRSSARQQWTAARRGPQFWTGAAVVAIHAALLGAAFTYQHYHTAEQPQPAMLMVSLPDMQSAPTAAPPEPIADIPLPSIVAPVIDIAPTAVPATVQSTIPAPATMPVPATSPAVAAQPQPAPPATGRNEDLLATLLQGAPPVYPQQSRRLREQGTVVLAVTVGTDGQVQAIEIRNSSGHRRLDQAALQAVRKWRWKPFIRNGAAAIVAGLVEIPFELVAQG